IKRLQDGQSSFLQAPSQDTCAYFQRSGEVASAPFPCAAKFPSQRAAHYSRLFRFVNTFFQGRLTGVDVVADAASSLGPRAVRRCEPPIMPDFSSPSTPSFDQLVRRWWRRCSRVVSGEAMRCSKGANSRDPADFVKAFFCTVMTEASRHHA
ncbi:MULTISPECIES: hypothetical protein, partial [Stenotrophomonas maltophilia group]